MQPENCPSQENRNAQKCRQYVPHPRSPQIFPPDKSEVRKLNCKKKPNNPAENAGLFSKDRSFSCRLLFLMPTECPWVQSGPANCV